MAGAYPFVVFTAPRSGSSWLIDLLSSHPDVLAYGELMSIEAGGSPTYGSPGMRYFESQSLERAPYLTELFASRGGVGAIGFKLVYGQAARRPGLLHELSDRRVRAVHLLRSNLLETVLSFETARANGAFHVKRGEQASFVPVRVDVEGLRMRLEEQDWMLVDARARLERRGFVRIEVFYEELVERREETLARILEYLHVDPSVELESDFVKSPGSIADRVENLEEVADALSGTRFEWMLGAVSRREEPVASSFR